MIPQFAKLTVTKGSHTTQSLCSSTLRQEKCVLVYQKNKIVNRALFVIVNKTKTITRNESFVHQQQNEDYTVG